MLIQSFHKILLSPLILLLVFPLYESAQADCHQLDWNAVQKNISSIEKLLQIIPPKSKMGSDCSGFQDAQRALDGERKSIGKQMLAGNPLALRLAIRLIGYTDGALAEEFSSLVASQIVKMPELYLRELKNANDTTEFCTAVDFLGEDFVDNEAKAKEEFRMRAKALAGVKVKKLDRVRAVCLKVLKQHR